MALLNNEKKNTISAKTQPRIAAPAVNKIADGMSFVVPFRTFNCFHVCGDVFVSFLFLNLRDCKLVV